MMARLLLPLLIVCITFHVLNGTSIYKKANKCEKLSRQLMNRIKNASKDYKYLINSFDCNLRYIFDGAYGEFHSNLFELNGRMEKATVDDCRESYESEVAKLGESPYDYCYNSSEISQGYETISSFERSAQVGCKGCNGVDEDECVKNLMVLSEDLEAFSNSSGSNIKALEKRVEECVTRKVEVVSRSLRNINESINNCM